MTDETPQSEGEPSPAVPDETPTAETTPFTYDDAARRPVKPTCRTRGTGPDATQATPVAPVAPVAAAPVAAAPATTTVAEDRPAGIFIPKWVGHRRGRDRRRARVRRHRVRDRRLVVGLRHHREPSALPGTVPTAQPAARQPFPGGHPGATTTGTATTTTTAWTARSDHERRRLPRCRRAGGRRRASRSPMSRATARRPTPA